VSAFQNAPCLPILGSVYVHSASEPSSRRAGDRRSLHRAFRQAVGWVFAQWDPVAGGRLLLLAAGVVATATVPLLDHDVQTFQLLGTVSASMILLLLASYVVPWSRVPRQATVVFPVLVWLALAALGVLDRGLGANYTGLFYLCFTYLGLTQRASTSFKLAPLAGVAYIGCAGTWSGRLAVRVLIALVVWLLLIVLITELIERQTTLARKLRRAAHTDLLTGLANRRDLDHRLTTLAPGDTVVMCDLDHFKRLNDTQGHAAGDLILAEFGLVLQTCLREGDYAARYGGEEFVLLLPQTTTSQTTAVLQRLHQGWAILQPDITFSAGSATCLPARSPIDTLAAADHALYEAKASGRNQDIHDHNSIAAT
jgi:diguanylate cyclase (GGDEF)-like protein